MSKKLLIIGLDGVSWNVLNPMMENGYMPFMKSFIETGKSGILKSTDPPITPAAWTSFMTGLQPEEHGVRGFGNFQFKNGKFTYELNNSSHIRHKNIWHILSENNKKVCIVNLPLTYPPFEVNGILVSGFPVPPVKDCNYTYPESFKEEILREFPDYQPIKWGDGAVDAHGINFFVDRMRRMTLQRAMLSSYLLKREDWDVFMVHFQETDFLQHKYWHYIDKGHLAYTEEGFKKCSEYYQNLDQKLSEIVSIARGKEYSVLFMSDHGFQRCDYDIKINNWLASEKYLYVHKNIDAIVVSIIKNIANLLPVSLRARLKRGKVKAGIITNKYLEVIIDYERSVVFVETDSCTTTAYAHFIKNVPAEVKKRVVDRLLHLEAPDGKKLIKKISPYQGSDNIYQISFEEGVVATGTMVTGKLWCSKAAIRKGSNTGVHHRDGIIICEASANGTIPKEIHEVFNFILFQHGINDVSKSSPTDRTIKSLDSDEQEQIEKSLKDLGYL